MHSHKNKSKIKKNIVIILAALLLLSAFVLLLNLGQLSHLPFVHETALDDPLVAVMNDAGYSAVIDKAGTNVLILSPEDEVLSEISYNFITDTTPQTAYQLAMDDEHLYILDLIPAENGGSYTGGRVLVYNFSC